jgi:Zn-dependent M16 (insulinase) family peptidase
VFYPNIYDDQTSGHQEGRHYELNSEAGELNYPAVYNEMKALFFPRCSIYRKCKLAAVPDTPNG